MEYQFPKLDLLLREWVEGILRDGFKVIAVWEEVEIFRVGW